ncbi:hypothetical protein IFR05_002708 [Cadophora sp. M221]|nr:hypothetical protein IFR05_002708 [Cadophora sp. M221]
MASTSSCGTSPNSIPGQSSACAVTFERNNTAILAECCKGSAITTYTDFVPAPEAGCYQYCNISTPIYNESAIYDCLTNRERNQTLTGWSCRDEVKDKTSTACVRGVNRVVLGAVVVAVGGWVLGSGGI